MTAVAVTGVAMITPAGNDATSTWERMRLGTSTASADPKLDGLPVTFSCRADSFDADRVLGRQLTWRLDRFLQLAIAVARQAVADAGLDATAWDGERVGVVVGASGEGDETAGTAWKKLLDGRHKGISPSTIPRGAANMAAGEISLDLNARGPGLSVHTACASGATAISVAHGLLRSG
ncbi:beta-ketoacyl synthase N-terminal-like domain-containing protein, partial [Streptomyces sp. NPDC049577]|uniref:beta-ketoacyl synthase N-terminal-like domain-containing protein n=1 Tax=Streptomyces sp. NPDC049577 TaxID=3155153 RepID=UPI00341E7272